MVCGSRQEAVLIGTRQPTFYEQVLGVNICIPFLWCCWLMFATHVALYRVSIRTLCELRWYGKLGAGWGSVEESMLPVIGRPR